jgi:nucleoside-diphosphate-sugar epimerase
MKIALFGAAGWLGRAILSKSIGRAEIRAFDRNEKTWDEWRDIDGDWEGGEIVHGDITDFDTVDQAISGVDAVIHTAVYFPAKDIENDPLPFLVNLKGLWNVLETARRREIGPVVHVGSCQTIHPQGIFFDADVRRPDGSLYAVCKRLQEEMCRQFHDAFGSRIAVLRPDYIVDSKLGIGRHRENLGPGGQPLRQGWICRHDLAEACLLAAESDRLDFEVLHVVGSAGAEEHCNVNRTKEILGLEFQGDLDQYR